MRIMYNDNDFYYNGTSLLPGVDDYMYNYLHYDDEDEYDTYENILNYCSK